MDKKLINITGELMDFLSSKIHSGVHKVEKKVDNYKQLRDLEIQFLQFGIKTYEHFLESDKIPSELASVFSDLKTKINLFENSKS